MSRIGADRMRRASLLRRHERRVGTVLENSRRQGTAALQKQNLSAIALEGVAPAILALANHPGMTIDLAFFIPSQVFQMLLDIASAVKAIEDQ